MGLWKCYARDELKLRAEKVIESREKMKTVYLELNLSRLKFPKLRGEEAREINFLTCIYKVSKNI